VRRDAIIVNPFVSGTDVADIHTDPTTTQNRVAAAGSIAVRLTNGGDKGLPITRRAAFRVSNKGPVNHAFCHT
jgi:hypothetical protein